MENTSNWDMKILINELTQGREVAKQLKIHLNVPSSSLETRELLVEKIINCYENVLSMLNCGGSTGVGGELQAGASLAAMSESPRSFNGSPHSEDSDRDVKDQEHKEGSRKRKSIRTQWTKQVQICPGSGLEGPLDDGYNWRKYGQKDILGAKYPRGYYRCTHRNVQGCLATKQVQRSDENPTIFDITYRGTHTCTPSTSHSIPRLSSHENIEPKIIENTHQFIPSPQQNQPEILLNFKTGLKVITDELETHEQQNLSSFSNSSSFPLYQTDHKVENYAFLSSMVDNNLGHNFSPSFISPATSGSNYFSMSPIHMNLTNVNTSESELNEIVSSAVTSATNSPTVGLDYPFGHMEYDSNFTFDNPGFFS